MFLITLQGIEFLILLLLMLVFISFIKCREFAEQACYSSALPASHLRSFTYLGTLWGLVLLNTEDLHSWAALQGLSLWFCAHIKLHTVTVIAFSPRRFSQSKIQTADFQPSVFTSQASATSLRGLHSISDLWLTLAWVLWAHGNVYVRA